MPAHAAAISLTNHAIESVAAVNHTYSDVGLAATVDTAFVACLAAGRNQCTILISVNMASTADAQHFAAEPVRLFYLDPPGRAAIALGTDTSILTAVGNGYGCEDTFSPQISALGVSGDVVFAISTSSNSSSIHNALEQDTVQELTIIGLTGRTGCKVKALCCT